MASTSRQKEWYQENLEREREKRRNYSRRMTTDFTARKMFDAARNRCSKNKTIFTITLDDVVIPEFCPILKQPLKVRTRYAPSLDRIVPSLGYIPGNVWVISRKANVMKNDATYEELQEFSKWVKTFQP